MSKFLLIGSVAAMLYGDCVFAMDDIDPWRSASSSESQDQQNSESTSFNSPRQSRSNSQVSLKNEDPNPIRDAKFERVAKDQNRFIKIGFENFMYGSVKTNRYQQYHYDLSDNALVGQATPTTIETITREDLRSWGDISEIRYANDVSYDKLENPKAILYRNMDKSCYIILRIKDTKYDVFYGLNERNIEVGRSSFAVYEMSDYVGSFTDNVARLIYVDESGLYFVPKAENSVEDVIKTYQSEGKFNFKGSVIKVSAIDGTITLDGEPVTANNFFDNWVLEESGTEKQANTETLKRNFSFGNLNDFGETKEVARGKVILSTKQPGEKEILRNFYPPNGSYREIYWAKYQSSGNTYSGWMNAYGRSGYVEEIVNLINKIWLNSFINTRVSIENSKSKGGAEELVRNGTFASILETYTDKHGSNNHYRANSNGYGQKVRDAIAAQIAVAKGKYGKTTPLSISEMVSRNPGLFKDPEFVRSLKSDFAKLEKDYEESRIAGSDKWLPFEIVKNL